MALDPAVRAEIVKDFPHLAYMLNIPGLGDFFQEMHEKGILSGTEFEQQFWASDWFRSHADVRRSWITLQETDPATAQLDIQRTASDITNMASQAGLTLSDEAINEMATAVMEWGLDDNDITAMIAAEAGSAPVTQTGSIAATMRNLQERAGQYFTNLSDEMARHFATEIFAGRLTLDGVYNQFASSAAEFFPQFKDSIDRGLTLDAATYGMRTHVAGLLNTTAEAIDLTDQRFSHLIDRVDEQSGERRAANLSEITKWSRQQEEFRTGTTGMAEGAGMAMNFLQVMGKVKS